LLVLLRADHALEAMAQSRRADGLVIHRKWDLDIDKQQKALESADVETAKADHTL